MSHSSFKISADLEFECLLSGPVPGTEEIIVLLHGFRDSNLQIFNNFQKMGSLLNTQILAPNAPFPFRTKSQSGDYQLEYSWYFFDPDKKRYLKTMETSLQYIEAGLEALKLTDRPKRIVGYSQGGYIAPFLGQKLKNTKQVIGVACEFYTHEMQGTFPFPIDAIHGDLDAVVKHSAGKQSHERLSELGISGEFHTIFGIGHSMDEQVKTKICELIQKRRMGQS